MGFQKKIFNKVYAMSRHNPRVLKKLALFAGAAFLGFIVITGLLVYSAISGLKGIATSPPDIEILAMQELIANKAILLTEAQKSQMIPLVQKLSGGIIPPEDKAAIKRQIYGLLDSAQTSHLDEWKSVLLKKAGEFTSTPQNIASAVERYTGISMKPLQGWIDALLSWWKITKPAASAKSLGDTLNENK